ncbi:hypothetical protein [Streptomyces sp. F63]|uniref:hypothetical protein n=1 Tax=Streptomyces sp. F63 TaxID=2824887 RepID=UPI001FFDA45B|nr:hypothetical protein [Streptomyces sp. F63]
MHHTRTVAAAALAAFFAGSCAPATKAEEPSSRATASAACTDDVFDMLIRSLNGEDAGDSRPQSCTDLTDEQWRKLISEQADKALDASTDRSAVNTPSSGRERSQLPEVVFKVWGSAASGVTTTYGSDAKNLGSTELPMTKRVAFDPDAVYYQVSVQLAHSGGDIRCSITIDGQTTADHAKGSYEVCSTQLNNLGSKGWG